MSNLHIIRAWKDPDYRHSLKEAQRDQLPAHPAGAIKFRDRGLETALAPHTYSPCHKCTSTGP
jgi:mersacidin/lichenicidin family type 2 lantibiotic